MTIIIRVDPVRPDIRLIRTAARIIREGGTVAFPTETVYGLGANALDRDAVLKIFAAKRRHADNPLIVHICDMKQLREVSQGLPKDAESAAKVLWPGPVTFLVRRKAIVPDETVAGSRNVAVRMPAHPVALSLIRESGVPIAAPSANLSTRPSPTKAGHVIQDLKGKVDAIIDGGDTTFGLESTIIDVTSRPYRLLRPGAVGVEDLKRYFPRLVVPAAIRHAKESKKAIVPGMKYRHYAPRKALYLAKDRAALESFAREPRSGALIICGSEFAKSHRNVRTIALGSESNLYEVARNLFDSFRRLDMSGAKFGVIQKFEEKGIGFAVMNRIRKASKAEISGSASVRRLSALRKQ